jgi:hypothetical protein
MEYSKALISGDLVFLSFLIKFFLVADVKRKLSPSDGLHASFSPDAKGKFEAFFINENISVYVFQ